MTENQGIEVLFIGGSKDKSKTRIQDFTPEIRIPVVREISLMATQQPSGGFFDPAYTIETYQFYARDPMGLHVYKLKKP